MLTKSRKGFTLLEVLVATVLVGIGIFAIMEGFNRGYLGVGEAEDYSVALSLSEQKMEELRDLSYADIVAAPKAAVPGFPNFQQEVIVVISVNNLKHILVNTYWTVPNGEKHISLQVYRANGAETLSMDAPLYRLYHPTVGDHLYTTSAYESQVAQSNGYVAEIVSGYMTTYQHAGTQPLYRLYNPNAGFHFYTMNVAERNAVVAAGYRDEGITGYILPTQGESTSPLYRLYNLNHGSHVYTMNQGERNALIAGGGYRDEGITGYMATNSF